MPDDPHDMPNGTERPRVAPPVFTPPRIVTPDTVLKPGEMGQTETAHPESEVRGVLTPKMMTSEPVYDDEEDEDVVSQSENVPAAQRTSGNDTSSAPQMHPATPAPADAHRPAFKKIAIMVAYGAIAVMIITLAWTFIARARGAQAAVANDFVAHIQQGDGAKAYALTSDRFRDVTSKDSFQEYAAQEGQILPKSEPKVVDTVSEQSGSVATTTVAIDMPGSDSGSSYHAVIRLIKQDGEWLVYSSDIKSGLYSEPLSTSR